MERPKFAESVQPEPFYPGTYHTAAGKQLSIGFESANVVQEVFARTHGDFSGSVAELTNQLTIHAKVAESVGAQVAASTGWTFMGVALIPSFVRETAGPAAGRSGSRGRH
jgi:uncharacterized protein (UPF0210 family)